MATAKYSTRPPRKPDLFGGPELTDPPRSNPLIPRKSISTVLDSDAINSVAELALKRVETGNRWFHPTGEPSNILYLDLKGDGTFVRTEAGQDYFNAKALDIPTITRFLSIQAIEVVSVWYNRASITGIAAISGRGDKITLLTPNSKPFRALNAIDGSTKAFKQKELYDWLRTTMFGTFELAYPNLVSGVANLVVKKGEDKNTIISQQGVSMDRRLLTEVKSSKSSEDGKSPIPEYVTFTVPVFDSPLFPVQAKITVCIDVDAEKETFNVTVLPGNIESAFVTGEAFIYKAIADDLKAQGVESPIFYGSPW